MQAMLRDRYDVIIDTKKVGEFFRDSKGKILFNNYAMCGLSLEELEAVMQAMKDIVEAGKE